ncbi:MAG TPA: cyclic nucleotide-binding domain-containing protein [Acidimicrobiia bacterium]|jgi:CRP-like cAMP-binding protein
MAVLKRQSDRVDVLAQVPLFEGLSKKDLTQIARRIKEVEFVPGDHLITSGASGDEAFVVLEGRATVRKNGRKIAELTSGDIAGEMSLITDLPRSAGVRADTFLPALRIERTDLNAIMDEYPTVAVKLLRTVARRLVEAIGSY